MSDLWVARLSSKKYFREVTLSVVEAESCLKPHIASFLLLCSTTVSKILNGIWRQEQKGECVRRGVGCYGGHGERGTCDVMTTYHHYLLLITLLYCTGSDLI